MPEDSAAEVDMVKFRADARIRYLTEEQLNKVLKVPKINTTSGLRTYVAVYLLAATGIRQGELLALHRSDLSDKEHLLRIRAETSKSKRERYVPLPEEQRGERITLAPEIAGPLMKYVVWRDKLGLGPEDALFVNNQGQSWSRFSLSSVLKRIGQKLGFTLSAHVFRHTCAVMLLKKSGDLKLVYDILGHSTFEVTKQYLRFTPADIQARYRAAGHMGSVIVPTRKLPSAADVDKAIKKFGKTERELSDMLFEVSLREG
jgi:integrase/recombinase XerD